MHIVFFVLAVYWTCVFSETCITPQGVSSDCVQLDSCPQMLAAFEQRPIPSNVVSYLRRSQCGFAGYKPRVCCGPIPKQANQPAPTPTPQPTRSPPIASEETDPVFDEDSSPAPRNECGIGTNVASFVYGGKSTDLDEFPWMALLGYRTGGSGTTTYQCGGALINKRYILTAAHCLIGDVDELVGTLITVRLGEYDTRTAIDCVNKVCADPPQDIAVQAAYPHPGYNDTNKNRKDDIGLVRLAKRAQYTYYVRPICLANNDEGLDVGSDLVAAGWGETLSGKNSPVKQKIWVQIFDKSKCIIKYRTLGVELSEKQLCAGGVLAEDTCEGDSGGPLMKRQPKGIWESVGIVSFGYDCGRDGWPGVYSSVAASSDWIRSTLQSTNA